MQKYSPRNEASSEESSTARAVSRFYIWLIFPLVPSDFTSPTRWRKTLTRPIRTDPAGILVVNLRNNLSADVSYS